LLLSCNKKGAVPSYIYIESFEVLPSAQFGSNSSNIADVWVYQNDNLQGIYELPAKFPIIAEGKTKLKFLAGIKINGITNTRAPYSFYDFHEEEIELVPTEIDTVFPKVEYLSYINAPLLEDFEIGNNFNNMERYNDSTIAFEGNGYGRLPVNSENDTEIIAYSATQFSVPALTTAAYVEMDYKNNAEFSVGLKGYKTGTSEVVTVEKLTITTKDSWNKIYINFTPEIGRIQADKYELIIRYVKTTDVTPVDILFDNIKVIYL